MVKKHSLNNPLYIGDTSGDEKAAKLAGIKFIHVSYGFGKPISENSSFSSFDELVKYLKNKNGERKTSLNSV